MTRFDQLPPNYIACADCGEATRRRSGSQRYCRACSAKRDRARKAKWARTNPQKPDPDKRRANDKRRREALHEAGMAGSTRRGMSWMADDVDPEWIVRVAVPFTYAFSKNHIWQMGGKSHVHLGEEHRAVRDALALALKTVLRGVHIAHNRLWVDIFVQKPDHKGDAVNVVDGVCDAVQDATGLNDRWYSLRRLDWEIVKEEPKLYIGLSQDDLQDVQACSYCTNLLPFDEFGSNRSTRTGRARTCLRCSRAADSIRRAKKAAESSPEVVG